MWRLRCGFSTDGKYNNKIVLQVRKIIKKKNVQ